MGFVQQLQVPAPLTLPLSRDPELTLPPWGCFHQRVPSQQWEKKPAQMSLLSRPAGVGGERVCGCYACKVWESKLTVLQRQALLPSELILRTVEQ